MVELVWVPMAPILALESEAEGAGKGVLALRGPVLRVLQVRLQSFILGSPL